MLNWKYNFSGVRYSSLSQTQAQIFSTFDVIINNRSNPANTRQCSAPWIKSEKKTFVKFKFTSFFYNFFSNGFFSWKSFLWNIFIHFACTNIFFSFSDYCSQFNYVLVINQNRIVSSYEYPYIKHTYQLLTF